MHYFSTEHEAEAEAGTETGTETEDCVWGDWSTWSSCSKLCGMGTNTRIRKKIEIERNGGNCTGSGTESKTCNTHSCSKVSEVLSRLAGQVATAGGAFAVASFINLPPLPMTLASGIPPGKYAISYLSIEIS